MKRLMLILAVVAGCKSATTTGNADVATTDAAPPTRPDAAMVATTVVPVMRNGLPWYEDEPAAAFAAAKNANKPVFLDLWAPWCPPCLQMRNFVLRADALGPDKDRMVFLAINVERAENADFFQAHAAQGLPSFYVVDPLDDSVLARVLGSAPIADMRRLIADGASAFARKHDGAAAADPLLDLLDLLAAGDAATSHDDAKAAAAAYRLALARGGPTWARAADARLALAMVIYADDPRGCVDTLAPDVTPPSAGAAHYSAALTYTGCTWALENKDPTKKGALAVAVAIMEPMCFGDDATITADDRATACRYLWGTLEAQGKAKDAKAAAEHRLELLHKAVDGMPPELAASDDEMLTETFIYLKRYDAALANLTARETALPKDYNAPYFIAWVYGEQKQWDASLAALDRAIKLAYGPKLVRMINDRADTLVDAGRLDDAAASLAEASAALAKLPEPLQGKNTKNMIAGTAKKLAAARAKVKQSRGRSR